MISAVWTIVSSIRTRLRSYGSNILHVPFYVIHAVCVKRSTRSLKTLSRLPALLSALYDRWRKPIYHFRFSERTEMPACRARFNLTDKRKRSLIVSTPSRPRALVCLPRQCMHVCYLVGRKWEPVPKVNRYDRFANVWEINRILPLDFKSGGSSIDWV